MILTIISRVGDNTIKRHENNAISVSFIVSQLQNESFDPILFFKPQGRLEPECPNLPESAFVLAVQSKFQLDLYKEYASTILCIDSTHGTNQYKFKLLTISVADNLGKGNL